MGELTADHVTGMRPCLNRKRWVVESGSPEGGRRSPVQKVADLVGAIAVVEADERERRLESEIWTGDEACVLGCGMAREHVYEVPADSKAHGVYKTSSFEHGRVKKREAICWSVITAGSRKPVPQRGSTTANHPEYRNTEVAPPCDILAYSCFGSFGTVLFGVVIRQVQIVLVMPKETHP